MDLRPTLSAYVHQRVHAFHEGFRHNLAILGPTGAGKTFLLHQALPSDESPLLTVWLTLQPESMRTFLSRVSVAVLQAVVQSAGQFSLPASADGHDALFDVLLGRAAQAAPKTAEAVRRLAAYQSGHLQAEALSRALDVIPMLHQELNRPVILVLDEFLHLEDLGVSHAFHELGKRVMTWPFALFLLTSSSSFRAREILRERLHLLFGQFEVIQLGNTESAVASLWMAQELPQEQDMGQALEFLRHWVGASPWYIRVMLNRMKELILMRRNPKSAEQVLFQAAWDVVGSSDGVLHQWCASHLQQLAKDRYGQLAKEALAHMAQGLKTTQAIAQQCGQRRSLSLALQSLVERDLIERKGACWVITDPLLACWLSAQARGRPLSEERFSRLLQDLWHDWRYASAQPLADRVGQLLTLFRNETVSLDHKTARLPSFQQLRAEPSKRLEAKYLIADGEGRRWCCLVHEGVLQEADVTAFETFCRAQTPRPARKVVVAKEGLDVAATLLAKAANMWVWKPDDMALLGTLYGQSPASRVNHQVAG